MTKEIDPKDITFIGAIEGTWSRFVEKEYLLMVRSLRRNGGVYSHCDVIMFQPTQNDISIRVHIELKKLGVHFIKNEKVFVDNGRGFLNMPYTCNHLSEAISTRFMLWLDCDCYIFSEPKIFELKRDEVSIHGKMEKYKNFYDQGHRDAYFEDVDAQKYLCRLIKGNNNLRHINTWFILAETRSSFWLDWFTETRNLVKNVYDSQDRITKSEFMQFSGQCRETRPVLEYALSSVEEIAAGLVMENYNLVEPIGTAHQFIDNSVNICHYDDWNVLNGISNIQEIKKDMREIGFICR